MNPNDRKKALTDLTGTIRMQASAAAQQAPRTRLTEYFGQNGGGTA